MSGSERYFIGMGPPTGARGRLAELQREVWIARSDQLLRPLMPHVTMLPPPFANQVPRTELARRMRDSIPHPYSFEVNVGQPELVEAYLGHTALVLPIQSERAERLRADLFRAVDDNLQPQTRLHLTLCQPLECQEIPQAVVEEFTESLAAMPSSFTYTGLTAFIDKSERLYCEEPFVLPKQFA